jgi:hypothetical protein
MTHKGAEIGDRQLDRAKGGRLKCRAAWPRGGLVLVARAQQQRPTAARRLGAGGGGAAGRGGHEAFGRSLHPIARAAPRRAPRARAPPAPVNRRASGAGRSRAAGADALCGHDRGQHPVRPGGRDPRRGHRGRQGATLHPEAGPQPPRARPAARGRRRVRAADRERAHLHCGVPARVRHARRRAGRAGATGCRRPPARGRALSLSLSRSLPLSLSPPPASRWREARPHSRDKPRGDGVCGRVGSRELTRARARRV